VVAETVVAVDVDEVGFVVVAEVIVVATVDVVVVGWVVFVVAVVVEELQDANTIEVTIRNVSNIQMIPLFICASFLFENLWKFMRNVEIE
jgi:hypothetical protein